MIGRAFLCSESVTGVEFFANLLDFLTVDLLPELSGVLREAKAGFLRYRLRDESVGFEPRYGV
jgi:hypothetical protein